MGDEISPLKRAKRVDEETQLSGAKGKRFKAKKWKCDVSHITQTHTHRHT